MGFKELIKLIKRKKFFFFILTVYSIWSYPLFVAAKIVPDCAATGDCTLEDFLLVFINLSKLILGVVGALALAYFIVGGFIFLTSGGSQNRVKKGKSILIGTLTGIIIVMGAWLIIYFIEFAVGLKPGYSRLKNTPQKVREEKGFCLIIKKNDDGSCGECLCLGGTSMSENSCKQIVESKRISVCNWRWIKEKGNIVNCAKAKENWDECSRAE